MSWRGTKASILPQAAEDEIQHAVSRQCVRMSEQMESCQAPVDAADAQVLGKVILQLISPLFVSVSASALTCSALAERTVSRL